MTYYSVPRAESKLQACFSVVKKKKKKNKQARTPNIHQNYFIWLLQIIVAFMQLWPACSQNSETAIPQRSQFPSTGVFPKFFIKQIFWEQRMHMGISNANLLFTDSDTGLSKYIPPVKAIKKMGFFSPLQLLFKQKGCL